MTSDDEVVEFVVRVPRGQLAAYREEHRLFLLRLKRDHDNVAMSGPAEAEGKEQARLARLAALRDALTAGRTVTRAALATGATQGSGTARSEEAT